MSALLGVKTNYTYRHLKDADSVDAIISSLPALTTEWKPIDFNPENVKNRLKKDGISLNKVNRTLGISRNTAGTILSEECPLSRFVNFCNAFGFNLGEFISDSTLPRLADENMEIRKEIIRLRKEQTEVRAAAYQAEQKLQRLKDENAALKLELMQGKPHKKIENSIQQVNKEKMECKFNYALLENLSGILNTNPFAMSKRMGMSVDTLRRHLLGKIDCRVDILVALCNEYHLDISLFFMQECTTPVVVEESRWQPVHFHPEIICEDADKKYSCKKLIEICESKGLEISQILEQNIVTSSCEHSENKYYYNKELFQLLPKLLNVSHRQIGIDTGHTIHTYGGAVKSGDILMYKLVDVCNAYKIPISLFFPKEGYMSVPTVITDRNLDEQEFYPHRIMEFYRNNDAFKFDMEKILNSPRRMNRYISKDGPMMASELVDICNHLGVSPLYFFENHVAYVGSVVEEKYTNV